MERISLKALVLTAVRRLELLDVEKPKPPPGWVLLRVIYSASAAPT
jgi:threonine dehydrogenase-like Zn-dependent dehydrogenase